MWSQNILVHWSPSLSISERSEPCEKLPSPKLFGHVNLVALRSTMWAYMLCLKNLRALELCLLKMGYDCPWLPPRNTPPPHRGDVPNLIAVGQTVKYNMQRSAHRVAPSAFSHSWSSELTQTDQLPMAYGPVSYGERDKRFSVKNEKNFRSCVIAGIL